MGFLKMSGIAGIFRWDGAPISPDAIERMVASMSFRGPDDIGFWASDGVAIGHCMLRTTFESLEEVQPLSDERESVVLSMDGRLNNWLELRADLLSRGATLRSHSDSELVLRAYQYWGCEFVHHLRGDFAILIWDAAKRKVICACRP